MKQLIRGISKDTRRKCMKESNTLAKIAAMNQLKRAMLKDIRKQCTKELKTLAKFAAFNQLVRKIWSNTYNMSIK